MSSWIKLDTDSFMHPKILGLEDDVRWLWVAGLCYSGMHLTDGELPSEVLPVLTRSPRTVERSAGDLVAAGLWELTDTGYRIVGYTDRQRTKAEVDEAKRRARDRQRRYREARDDGSEPPTSRRDNDVTDGVVTPESQNRVDKDTDKKTPQPPAVDSTPADFEIGAGEDQINEALDAYADRVTANADPRNRVAYRSKVRANVSELQRDRAAQLLAGWVLTSAEVGQVLASEHVDEQSPLLMRATKRVPA